MSEEREVYMVALETYGEQAQIAMVFEEMAELQKALCKYLRDPYPKNFEIIGNIAEEIADVEIMLGQMKLLLEIGDGVERYKKLKISRLQERLK